MQLGPKLVPPFLQNSPVGFVVSALENNGPDFDPGNVPCIYLIIDRLAEHFLPQTSETIDSPNLLLNDARIPFGMEEQDGPAFLVEIEPFPPYNRLCNQHAWKRELSIEGELQ